MSVSNLLNKSCYIRRNTAGVSSTTGGPTVTIPSLGSAVPCAVQVKSQNERTFGVKDAGVAEYVVYFAIGTDVKNGDLIYDITGMTNVVLEVKGPPTEGVGRTTYIKVTCETKQGFKVA